MKNTLETRLGVFVALAVIAAVLILETVGGTERFQRGYRLHALFNNVQDLKEGDRVKKAGVEIGRVEKIGFATNANKVEVTMKIRREVEVKTDSVATIKFIGLMGQNFVSIDFGTPTAPAAAPNSVLASAEQPDLSAVMAKIENVATGVENLTKSFTGEKIDNLLGPFTDFLKANQGPLTATIANMNAISKQISSGQGTVGKLIYDDALYTSALVSVTNLQEAAAEIRTTVADARKVVDQVNSGQGTVGKLLKDETLYKETTASMTNLKEILQKINQGEGSVGKLVNDRELYNNAKLTLQKLDKATEGLEDQGPLSVMGILVNGLF
jgi:phospholipid/cholesterol/gamma-HCH transport system substrate-binding protein